MTKKSNTPLSPAKPKVKHARPARKAATQYVDYLMWVGAVHYPTADDYITEARSRGACKRLGRVPLELLNAMSDPGLTPRIFLAHDEGLVGEGFVFGYFIPTELQYICHKPEDVPYNIADTAVPVLIREIADEEERGCGHRTEGTYIVVLVETEVSSEDSMVFWRTPRDLEAFDPGRGHFRGMLRINYGSQIVKAKRTQMRVPPSRNAAPAIPERTPWTEEEDEVVLETLAEADNKANAAQKLSFATGRSKTSIIYRYRILTGGGSEEGL